MNDHYELYKKSLTQWQENQVNFVGCVDVNWAGQNLDLFKWEKTFSIDELPQDDLWNTSATKFKLWQEDLYQSWGHCKSATEHYMCFEPDLQFDLEKILQQIGCEGNQYTVNLMKIPVGRLIPWHCDTYGYAVKKFNIPQSRVSAIKRTIIFMQDWSFGQITQFGDSVVSHWKAGDMFSWDHECWHGLANFGSKDIVVMQITHYV